MADCGPSIKQITVLDFQGNDLPNEVKKDLEKLANDWYLSNDTLTKYDISENEPEYPQLDSYLKKHDFDSIMLWIWW